MTPIETTVETAQVLSPTQVRCFIYCHARWWFKYCLKEPDLPNGNLSLGRSVHSALTQNFAQKVETYEDLPPTGVLALFRESWAIESDQAEFRDAEEPSQLARTGEALVAKYIDEVAPAPCRQLSHHRHLFRQAGTPTGVALREQILQKLRVLGHVFKVAAPPRRHAAQDATPDARPVPTAGSGIACCKRRSECCDVGLRRPADVRVAAAEMTWSRRRLLDHGGRSALHVGLALGYCPALRRVAQHDGTANGDPVPGLLPHRYQR